MTPRIHLLAALVALATAPSAWAQDDHVWASDGDMPMEWDEATTLHADDQVQLAQAVSQGGSSRSQGTRTASRAGRTSRVPYMIGDSPMSSGGSGGGVSFTGIPIADVDHPIFGGNRFNVGENNSATPGDRALISYRHYHNATQTNALGQANDLNVDRLDVGVEASMLDRLFSAQLVVPLLRQLNTDLDVYDDGFDSSLPITDRHGELGNLALAGKLLLVERSQYAFSAGLAVNIPTGDDARISQTYDEPDLVIAQSPLIVSDTPTNLSFFGRFDNETVNLTPFLAWNARSTNGFFHQGFLQIDAPVNRSDAAMSVSGTITPETDLDPESFNVSESGEIDQQTLMRLNLSFGYWFMQGSSSDMLQGLAGIFELHYLTTLEDANPFVVPITTFTDSSETVPNVPFGVTAGPGLNDIDQVNLTAGLAAELGTCQVTNGFIVPVTEGENRSFDFEYCLQVNRRF